MLGLLLAAGTGGWVRAQMPAQEPVKPLPEPAVTWTQEQDHQNMMEQLGIRRLRPGASGSETGPNHANYDEEKANPWPNYPDALTFADGKRVTSAKQWWTQRRPQIVAAFDAEVYGRVPREVPGVTWTVAASERDTIAGVAVTAKRLVGRVENASYPLIEVNLDMVLVLPANAHARVPVLMMFGRPSLPSSPLAAPPWAKLPGINGTSTDPPATEQLIADGWGYAVLSPTSVQADNGAGLTRGIIGLVNKGQPRKPDDWGALRAWAWGASRGLDYLETDAGVDAKHVGIEGVSRYGKAAIVTEAYDQRFFMGLIGSSGEGGVKPSRRVWGEQLENLTGGEYYWMAGSFMKYGAAEASFGAKTAGDLPVDSPELLALCAPRLVFVSYGSPAHGDARWLDQQGSFMATVAAEPVYALLGARGPGAGSDYQHATMPPVNRGLLEGKLAWRQHDGGHTDAPNVRYFVAWADGFMGRAGRR